MIAVAGSLVGLGVLWTAIKHDLRKTYSEEESSAQRLGRVQGLAGQWMERTPVRQTHDVDAMVARLWPIPLQARAMRRVPDVLPHTDGQLLRDAVVHVITPRLFFPEKKTLADQSTNMVRKYAGVWVAGAKQGTSIAFGYVAESYVDFGLPLMFVPIFVLGLLLGLAYRGMVRMIRNADMAAAVAVAVMWSSLQAYAPSWTMLLGRTTTLLLVLTAVATIVDRFTSRRPAHAATSPGAAPAGASAAR
jgi:hypothetical protein